MQLLKVWRFKWDRARKHSIQENSERPNIDKEAFIASILDDLRCQVGRCATLLLNNLAFAYDFADAKITNLNSLLGVKQYIIELDVAVDD